MSFSYKVTLPSLEDDDKFHSSKFFSCLTCWLNVQVLPILIAVLNLFLYFSNMHMWPLLNVSQAKIRRKHIFISEVLKSDLNPV